MFRGRANVVKMILSTQACLAQWIENCWFFERRGTSEKISSKSGLHAEEQIWELRGLERCRRRCQRDKTLITFLDTHHHKPSTFLRCRKFDTSYEKWISLFVKCLHFWSKALVAQPKRYSGDYFSLTFGGFPWTDTKKYWIKLFHLIKSSRMASSRINCVSWRSVASTVRSRVRKLRQDSRYNRVECCLRQSTSENRESKIARNINANDISHRRRQRRDIHDSWILTFSAFICRMFAVQTTEINTSIHMEIIRKRTCGPEYRRVQRTAYWMLEWQGNIPKNQNEHRQRSNKSFSVTAIWWQRLVFVFEMFRGGNWWRGWKSRFYGSRYIFTWKTRIYAYVNRLYNIIIFSTRIEWAYENCEARVLRIRFNTAENFIFSKPPEQVLNFRLYRVRGESCFSLFHEPIHFWPLDT